MEEAKQARLAAFRREELKRAKEEILQKHAEVPPDLEKEFERCRSRYWKARLTYSDYLQKNDPELWRLLVPCDPVITVDDDVVFFECFSADESSYGCLTVDREGGFDGVRGHAAGHDERRLFLAALRAFPVAPLLSRDAVLRRPGRLRRGHQRRRGLSRREDRSARRLAPRLHADPRGDGAADAAGVALARCGLFGPGLDEAAPAADQPAGDAIRVVARQAARARAGAVGAADRFARHEV